MSGFRLQIAQINGDAVATGVLGTETRVARNDHPFWTQIVDIHSKILKGEKVDEAAAFDLLLIPASLKREFGKLSERFAVEKGVIFYDGDPLNNAIADQILKVIDEGQPLSAIVNFAEKIMLNPTEHSREQAFRWFDRNDFDILDDGDVIVFKGCKSAIDENTLSDIRSSHNGSDTVIVTLADGTVHKIEGGYVPQPIGGTVEMARGNVHHDPQVACSTGLHVGTLEYAKGFSRERLLKCIINPRDIVSVPTDSSDQKIRVRQYRIFEEVDQSGKPLVPKETPVEVTPPPKEKTSFVDPPPAAPGPLAKAKSWLKGDDLKS